jgi:predicted ester cyclase
MNSIKETAAQFFDNCETGKGWDACSQYCHADATFSTQGDTFGGVETLAGYTEAIKGLIAGPIPDASYELKAFAVDEERNSVVGFAVFSGTHSGEGGPVAPANKRVETDYVYVMQFTDGKISDMIKIWNDVYAMRQLGWG